jgi:large subunit ribosomal protein L19
MNAIDWVNEKYHVRKDVPSFKAGDSVRVHVKIKEGDKERVQVYEGVVIRIHNNGAGSSFTVRKVSYGVGVERIFPFSCPSLAKIELVNSGKVRRAKLYYLRDLSGKRARITSIDKLNLLSAVKTEAVESVADVATAPAVDTVATDEKV